MEDRVHLRRVERARGELERVVLVGARAPRGGVEVQDGRVEVDAVRELRRVFGLHGEGDDAVAERALAHEVLQVRAVEAAEDAPERTACSLRLARRAARGAPISTMPAERVRRDRRRRRGSRRSRGRPSRPRCAVHALRRRCRARRSGSGTSSCARPDRSSCRAPAVGIGEEEEARVLDGARGEDVAVGRVGDRLARRGRWPRRWVMAFLAPLVTRLDGARLGEELARCR